MVSEEDRSDHASGQSEIVKEVLNSILDEVSDETEVCFDIYGVRSVKSIASIASTDVGDLSALSDDDSVCLEPIQSDPDSDVEFSRYLEQTAKYRKKLFIHEHATHLENKRSRQQHHLKQTNMEDEYETVPNFAGLSINCPEEFPLAKVGKIENIVGCIAVISSTIKVTLDLGTILFDETKKMLGEVVDVVGTVKEPLYCMKLPEEKLTVGTEVFFAPSVETLTKTILDANLTTPWQVREKQSDEEDAVFSDDEKEKEYYQKKKKNTTNVNNQRKRGNTGTKVRFATQNKEKGEGSNWNWNQKGSKKYSQYEYPAEIDIEKPNLSGVPPLNTQKPQEAEKRFSYLKANRKPNSTVVPNNPYPELGCYDEFLRQ
ncbi:unnamed protein product [Auanema sp. JU1783]|nr:unnamed protein product [Auanema sp. JU1783]